MQYDPIKKTLGNFFNRSLFLRKVFYDLLDLLLLRAWHVHHHLRRIFASFPPDQPVKVLDAGSGFGQYSYNIMKKKPHWKLTGIEIKEEQVEDCNRFFTDDGISNASFILADLTQYSKPDTYDLILSVDVMEHIEQDEMVFSNFHRSLKSQGQLVISTPSDQGGSDVNHHHDTSFIEEHVRDGYGKDEITQKLVKAGFNKVKVHYTYGFWGHISWLLSMKYPILLLGYSKLFFIILPFYYLVVYPFCLLFNFLDVHRQNKTGTGLLVIAQK
ncbi:MAG: class I SAM-dependent methyltransferase [Bacteroidales bacterium]